MAAVAVNELSKARLSSTCTGDVVTRYWRRHSGQNQDHWLLIFVPLYSGDGSVFTDVFLTPTKEKIYI